MNKKVEYDSLRIDIRNTNNQVYDSDNQSPISDSADQTPV